MSRLRRMRSALSCAMMLCAGILLAGGPALAENFEPVVREASFEAGGVVILDANVGDVRVMPTDHEGKLRLVITSHKQEDAEAAEAYEPLVGAARATGMPELQVRALCGSGLAKMRSPGTCPARPHREPCLDRVSEFASRGVLNSPWGIARGSFAFGRFSGDILVGNFGNGEINAFDSDGKFLGTLKDSSDTPVVIDGLWTLTLGGGRNSSSDTLYFTAGPNNETDGLFGTISPASTH